MYPLLFQLLKRLPPEFAHHAAFIGLRLVQASPLACGLVGRVASIDDPRLRVTRWGVDFPNPVVLAAGFDKDGLAPNALGALGFGAVEVGTVTAEAQPGNPRPRLFRLVDDRAIVNRMGFNNEGAARLRRRLERARSGTVIGVNIGKTKVCPPPRAPEDYAASARRIAERAAYCAVNVSSPNTEGLRDLQAIAPLRAILTATRSALDASSPGRRVPLLVKIAPDLADEDILEVADLALELRLDGIIATNTTIGRSGLRSSTDAIEACGKGGLSGPPVARRSLAVLDLLHARVGRRLTLVSVGGVATATHAWERLTRGASLVQLYTSFIYEGPLVARRIQEGLLARLESSGLPDVEAAIGSATGEPHLGASSSPTPASTPG
ncbi:MAG: quinone-dependent dihydroorotate dehydrogenase [Polyangiaceae bacterium]